MTKETITHSLVAASGFNWTSVIKKTEKLWGTEHIITNTEKYCVKIMTIIPDTQVSLHFHLKKEETFTLISGQLVVETISGKTSEKKLTKLMHVGDSLTLKPGTPHTFYCPADQLGPTVFVESSTQDFEYDSYRIYPSRAKDANSGGSDS